MKLRNSHDAIKHGRQNLGLSYEFLSDLFGVGVERIKQIAHGYKQVRTEQGYRMRKVEGENNDRT